MNFELHQPFRLKKFKVYDIGNSEEYFNNYENGSIFRNLAEKNYLPLNKLLLNLIEKYDGKFKVNFFLSGVVIEQMEIFAPEVLESFVELAKTGCVDFLGGTYYHSLNLLYSEDEFKNQVKLHSNLMKKHFGILPKFFKNVNFGYGENLENVIFEMGFDGIFTDNTHNIFDMNDSGFIYKSDINNLLIGFNNSDLSNDLNNNFFDKSWSEYPLCEKKYTDWVLSKDSDLINLFYNYNNFKYGESDIFGFFESFISYVMNNFNSNFILNSEIKNNYSFKSLAKKPFGSDSFNIESNFLGNKMQKDAISEMFELESIIKKLDDADDLINTWRMLTISDHFLFMGTDNLQNYNPYESGYDGYIYFMNVLNDLIVRCKLKEKGLIQKEIMKEPKKKGVLSEIKLAING